jgi:hypothetical protein
VIVRSSTGVFRWGQVFQRGDLPIYITDADGSPLDPFSVVYTLSYLPKNSACARQVGPCQRYPVKADVGEYYVTGIAGEFGQPGDWYVNWTLQEYFEGTLLSETFGFKVFNTATYCCPGSTYVPSCGPCGRHRSGW